MTLANRARALNPRPGPLPRLFLITDDRRLPDPLPVIARLPRESGVIFRHYDHPQRWILAEQVARLCRIRRLMLFVAADWRLARRVKADGLHLPQAMGQSGRLAACLGQRRHGLWISMACHDRMAWAMADRLRVDCIVLSPVFPTASHVGARGLGPLRFAQWARSCRRPVIALGGVNDKTAPHLRAAHGVAAIGGLC